MAYTAADVKNLRETTGAGMMDCKKALDETGDFQKAVDYLRAKGLAAAAKKQSRVAAEGMIAAVVKGKIAALVEVNCETDFVAKNDAFQAFATTAANVAVDANLSTVEQLLDAKAANGLTIKDNISELTIKIGEKIDVRRVEVMKLEGNGMIGSYVHSGKIGVLCRVESDKDVNGNEAFQTLVKDLCMQIAAANPQFLNASEIDETYKAKEAEIYAAQLKEQGKPEAMIPNIVKGKLAKLASEVCLYEQSFVKDPDTTIGKLIEATGKTTGASIKVTKFIKLNLGEGIEKKSENFAEEIAKLTGKN
ncbi:translation elongation factor Ts [Peredibacter sp. HCB2-198]|uniref:translation elongation factor Ts n=1 Tax=Peredibacter sp. HCB2-198 TaxID=3383025 RepID=UPI0038B53201